jgi:hypothetical protein
MMGAENVNPALIQSFAPGAMAENLTSWGAEFQKPQTKITKWIEAGATATAGMVVEPFANPNKFPSARFFEYYTSGCTILESFYQSIASPLQNLLLGDPLAKPYAPKIYTKILGANIIHNDFTYLADAVSPVKNSKFLYTFLLDGKEIQPQSDNSSIFIRAKNLADGYHELCVVASIQHFIQFNESATKSFSVSRFGRSIELLSNIKKISPTENLISTKIGGTEKPKTIRLISGTRILDEKPYTPNQHLILDEKILGEGPNKIQAIAIYNDGMEVASTPLRFSIKFSKTNL